MRTLGSVRAVVAAIHEDAVAEIERLERDAAAVPVAPVDAQPDTATPDSDPRVAAARRRVLDDELDEDWNDRIEDLQDREQWMAAIAEAGRRALADIRDRGVVRDWIRALVEEAAGSLPPGACVVVVPATVVPVLDASWVEQTAAAVGRSLSIEAGPVAAGCIVRLADRPIAYDNSLEARERRTEVEWRSALARVYAEATARATDAGAPGVAARPVVEVGA